MVPMTMPVTVPTVVPVMMPTDLRGLHRAVLDRRGGAGAAQRHRLSLLSGSGQNEQCAHGRKPQNFRHLHGYFSNRPWMSRLRRENRIDQPSRATQVARLKSRRE